MPKASILLGVIGRPHGVRGLLRVTSYAEPPEALASYGPLTDEGGRRFVLCWRGAGLAELSELAGDAEMKVADRAAAERLVNTRLYVARDRLGPTGPDEFYFSDLVGLAAIDAAAGASLGEVVAVHDYGAGASLEIARPEGQSLLVPFTRDAVPEVDLPGGRVLICPPAVIEPQPEPGVAP